MDSTAKASEQGYLRAYIAHGLKECEPGLGQSDQRSWEDSDAIGHGRWEAVKWRWDQCWGLDDIKSRFQKVGKHLNAHYIRVRCRLGMS